MFPPILGYIQKINFEGKKAIGASYYQGDKIISVKANKEVILSAGAIGSPQILQVSGIGNAKKLNNNGIEIIHELNGIGQNLQDHLMFRPVYKVKNLKSLNSHILMIDINPYRRKFFPENFPKIVAKTGKSSYINLVVVL